ncbi:ABC transporter substrate-binding protein [Trebonia kvetii]|uniref:ABC transporter substrate-binding protein n=1 Tax=Trebonia kvetii TaxID=2480626 RepID=A0A6P2BMU6_9ACTN|nr:ABC transporter substrate-binding protein [Trebonia kvetii]TVZ00292.1 ABC transporter substrate-binding protein [Trebonia kvetii]
MPALSSRRDFLRRTGLVALAAPLAATAIEGCANVAATTSNKASLLRVGWTIEPDSMNPLTAYSTEADEILALVYDNLMHYSIELKPEPGLATSWTYSDDGKSITYKLRSGVSWHDGKPFTAADAKFTFETIAKEQLGSYDQWVSQLTSAQAPDDHTLVLNFSAPQAFNPGLAVPILPQHIWQGMKASEVQKFTNAHPVGTGPYTFVSWNKGQSVTIKRNEQWWGTKPAAEKISWILFGNEDVMAQNLRTGAVDICPEVPPTIWDGLAGAQHVKTVEMESFSFHHIGINVSDNPKSGGNPLLKDRNVRLALSYAVDRQKLVDVALAGHGIPGSVLLPSGFGAWHLDIPAAEQLNANPAKAGQVLDAAGYKLRGGSKVRTNAAGKPLSFRLIAIESTSVDVAAAQIFRDACAAVGIQLTLTTLDANSLGNTVYNADAPNWDIFVWGWDSGVYDPDYMLGIPLSSQIGGNNDVYYADKHYDALYGQQAAEIDAAKRLAMVHQTQQYYYDAASYIVMWYQSKLQAYRTDTWTGWTPLTGGIILNFTRDNYLNARPV